MICKNDISNIKADIEEMSGSKQRIIVKGSLGRSKSFEKEATVEKAYPNMFIVKYDNEDRNATWSYIDVLTRTVELEVFDGEKYSPLLPPPTEETKRARATL
ncbi:MAG: Veg family protein [Clostridia bacterium]|nr:Veg family protein [Clostridia bacterium]